MTMSAWQPYLHSVPSPGHGSDDSTSRGAVLSTMNRRGTEPWTSRIGHCLRGAQLEPCFPVRARSQVAPELPGLLISCALHVSAEKSFEGKGSRCIR
jgi:hypothetical protein